MSTRTDIVLLDVVALTEAVPDHGLVCGQVGTVVGLFDNRCLVEFSDTDGRTYAVASLRPEKLIRLRTERRD